MTIEILNTEPIGRGYFGTVYHGKDKNLERDVAIKFFDLTEDRYIDEMRNHIQPLLHINHPSVLQIYQIEKVVKPESEDPEFAVIMEYVDGDTLLKWKSNGPYEIEYCKSLVTQLAHGVAAFHLADSPHGDLHSQNILVSKDGLKIIDPYCVGSSVVFSTTAQHERVKYDIRHLCNLICEILSASDDKSISQKFSMLFAEELSTAEDVILKIETMFTTDSVDAGSHFDNAQDTFLRSANRNKRALVSRTISAMSSNIAVWGEQNASLANRKGISNEVCKEFFSVCESAISTVLAGCVSNGSDGSHLRVLRTLCRKDVHEGSGASTYVTLPLATAAGAMRMAGAAALLAGNEQQILELVNRKIRLRNMNPTTMLENKHLSGWPASLGGNCVEAWKFWLDAYDWSGVLQKVFVTKTEYHASMFGFSVFASIASVAGELKTNGDVNKIVPGFAPMQMSYFGNNMDDVWDEFIDIMERFEGKTSLAKNLFNVEENELGDLWEQYRKFYMAFLQNIEDWYYDIPALLVENPFD